MKQIQDFYRLVIDFNMSSFHCGQWLFRLSAIEFVELKHISPSLETQIL